MCSSVELTGKELTHVGEEIADVFIYTTRLSDVCRIDLGNEIKILLQAESIILQPEEGYFGSKWSDISLKDLQLQSHSKLPTRSIRQFPLSLQRASGLVCGIFLAKTEEDSYPDLSHWKDSEILDLKRLLAKVILILADFASELNLDLSSCISDKFSKNSRKYPVNLVRGSSAKYSMYTTYQRSIGLRSSLAKFVVPIAFLGIGIVTILGTNNFLRKCLNYALFRK